MEEGLQNDFKPICLKFPKRQNIHLLFFLALHYRLASGAELVPLKLPLYRLQGGRSSEVALNILNNIVVDMTITRLYLRHDIIS